MSDESLERLDKDLRKIADDFAGKIPKESNEPSTSKTLLLYHYTNDKGLEGILKSSCLWLSEYSKLNDPSEWHYGVDHALTLLKEKLPPKSYERFELAIKKALKSLPFYLLSLTKGPVDDLNLWRAYADDGRGYALGFDLMKLEEYFGPGKNNKGAHPVQYAEPTDLEPLVARALDDWPTKLRDISKELDWAKIFAESLLYMAQFFKHPAYEAEQEYRFSYLKPKSTKYRTAAYQLTRYTEFKFPASALKEIWVGPSITPRARQFAEDLKQELKEFEDVEIKDSVIPYRPK